ncbi:Multidrug resistance protein MdtL [bioreactor metagenome]|uniref:Multidrug resistance protein MdtL n=2 Tax=root TaxID=1 RepID=A0A644T828_9ZZZZ
MGLGLVDPILPVISQQLGASQTEVAMLFTTYSAVMAVAMLVTDVVSSKLGIKRTLIIGVILIAIFSFLSGLSDNVWTIIFLRMGWGLGNALFVAVALTAIVKFSGNDTRGSIILYETALGLGFSIGPLLGGLLGGISWKYPFIGVGFLMLIGFILLITFLPKSDEINNYEVDDYDETEYSNKIKKSDELEVSELKNDSINNKKEEIINENFNKNKSLLEPFRLMKQRDILVLGVLGFLYNFGFFTLFAYSPFVLGLDAEGIGFVFLGWGILVAISSIFMAPKLRERYGTYNSIYYVLSLFVAILFIMGIFTSNQVVLIAAIIFSGILMGNNNTLLTTAMMSIGSKDRSTTSAAYNFIRFIGSAIAPLLATALGENISPNLPFIVGGLFVLASIIFLFLNRKHLPDVDASTESTIGSFKVEDFMVKEVIKINPETKIIDILRIFDKNKISGLPVVDNESKIIDIITIGDIIRYLVPKEESHDFFYSIYVEEETQKDVLNSRVNDTVKDALLNSKKRLYTLSKEDTFEKAMSVLSKHHFKVIPVLNKDKKVVGIVSRGDINNNLVKMSIANG